MIRKVLICLLGVRGLVFSWSCGSATTVNVDSANKAAAGNANGTASSAKPAAPSARKAEFTTTPEELLKEYKADPKSMEKYKGKVVEIAGKFSKTAGSADALEIKFEPYEASKDVVTCRINASAVQAAAKYQKGEEIKMTGIGDPYSIIGPLFKDCEVAQ